MRLHDFIDYRARERPDVEFAIQGERRVTYREANQAVNKLANAFVSSGLQVGDRVAVLAKNCIEYAYIYYAASKAGVVPVPLNYRLVPDEWAYIINDSGAKMLIAGADFVEASESLGSQLQTVQQRVAMGGVAPAGWTSYEDWVASQPATPPDRNISEEHDLYQMYTSGTTGHPKGAVLPQGSVTSNMAQVTVALQAQPGERSLIVAPMYHAAAAITTFNCIYYGGALYIMEDFIPNEVVRAMSEEKIALALLVPAMIQAVLVMVPDVMERSYQDLRMIVYGASPIAEQTLRKAIDVFKCDFAQGYGMTETTAVISFLTPDDHRLAMSEEHELLLSAGRPILGTDVRIVDDDDKPVPNGEIGEIIARGPQLMRGYWNLADESAEALKGGWMHTGDAGVINDDGYLFIQDRVKDMIVSGGENVYPRIVEEALFQHPAVADAAVIGVPDQQWGETVKAIVVLKEGQSVTPDEIMEFTKGKLGGFQRPRSVDFIDELPRNPSGKVLKRQLREPYWKGQTRRVAGV
jgi:acyl-CoA synthetase (AMP-forming)/AMP-acid ligase II